MTAYYVDTSAIVKRYIHEVGTPWITALVDPVHGHRLVTVRLTAPEFVAALFRRVRLDQVKEIDANFIMDDFREDWYASYRVLEITESVTNRAMTLARTHGLRGYDAVHLAAALEAHGHRLILGASPLIFVLADNDQVNAAVMEGLTVDNPLHHAAP